MGFFKREKHPVKPRAPWKITQNCLNLILESARSTFPREFGGLLRRDPDAKDTIIEVVLLPGTISGDSHAIFRLHMLPVDFDVVGTVHSHPSYHPIPSEADIALFGKFGKIHIIAARPYNQSSWKAFDYQGNEYQLTIV